jgi:hypothetical protein
MVLLPQAVILTVESSLPEEHWPKVGSLVTLTKRAFLGTR